MGRNVSSQEAMAAAASPRRCFVIGPIGEEGSPTRTRSDQVMKHIIKKALEPNYRVERADEINRPGTITVQVVQQVFDADLVVADLSGRNANVFYELAIRHATKKPSLHIVATGEEIPFDVNQIRAVRFDITNPDSIEDAQRRLQEQVKAIDDGETVITPVQFAQILRSLESGETQGRQILEILQGLATGISSVKSDVRDMVEWLAAYLADQLSPPVPLPGAGVGMRSVVGLRGLGGFRFAFPSFPTPTGAPSVEAAKPPGTTEEEQGKPER